MPDDKSPTDGMPAGGPNRDAKTSLGTRLVTGMSRLVQQRYPILAIGFLVVWTPLVSGIPPLQPLFANVLLLDTWLHTAGLACVTLLAVVFLMAIRRFVAERARQKVDAHAPAIARWNVRNYLLATAYSLIAPMCAVRYSYLHQHLSSWREALFALAVGTGLGLGVGWAFLWGLGRLHTLFFRSDENDENYFPFENRSTAGLMPRPPGSWHVQVQFFFYLLVVGITYGVVIRFADQTWIGRLFSVPTYVVFLVWIGGMLLAGMAYLLEPSRIPPLLLIVLWIAFMRLIPANRLPAWLSPPGWGSWTTVASPDAHRGLAEQVLTASALQTAGDDAKAPLRALEDRAWRAIVARMAKHPAGDKTLVIVTCPGGGIHAAAWSSFVLEMLDARYAQFSASIGLISGVSGGSVGSMFFAACRFDGAGLSGPPPKTPWIAALAMESSLEAVAAGLAFDDGPGVMIPLLRQRDRGQRLEDSWHQRLNPTHKPAPYLSLGSWAELAATGDMPILVFNTTDAASGRRVLFGSVPTPRRESLIGSVGRPWDYRELITQERDVLVTTAARVSATFPYVSPFVGPDAPLGHGRHVALGDGGYADNEGIVTAIDWIAFLSRRKLELGDEAPFKRILLLRIAPSPTTEFANAAEPNRFLHTFRWLTGPLEALAMMRGTSQIERGQLETDLATLPRVQEVVPASSAAPAPSVAADTETPGRRTLSRKSENGNPLQRRYDTLLRSQTRNIAEQFAREREQSGTFAPLEQRAPLVQEAPPTPAQPDVPSPSDAVATPADLPSWEPDTPIIVVEIPFISPTDEPIPLNWKLSNRQKQLYPTAWAALEQSKLMKVLDALLAPR